MRAAEQSAAEQEEKKENDVVAYVARSIVIERIRNKSFRFFAFLFQLQAAPPDRDKLRAAAERPKRKGRKNVILIELFAHCSIDDDECGEWMFTNCSCFRIDGLFLAIASTGGAISSAHLALFFFFARTVSVMVK